MVHIRRISSKVLVKMRPIWCAIYLVLFVVCSFSLLLSYVLSLTNFQPYSTNEVDGCFHVFLDVGSNVGVQVRKLYEIDQFPDAEITKWFDHYFGPHDETRNKLVCAVGFEPNPHHSQALEAVEDSHRRCGWRSYFKTNTAAGHTYGKAEMFSEDALNPNELGGTIINEEKNYRIFKIGEANMIWLSDFILNTVVTRVVPDINSAVAPAILVKVDVEGSELELLSDLLLTGALQHVNKVLVEYHTYFKTERNTYIQNLHDTLDYLTMVSKNALLSRIDVIAFDDETYFSNNISLPIC